MLTWFRKNMKGIMIVVAVLFVVSMFYGLGYQGVKSLSQGGGESSVIARVNGDSLNPIRYQQVLSRVIQSFGGNASPQDLAFIENIALGQAIDFTLMLSEAKKRVRVSGREVDGAIDSIMRQQKVPSKRQLESALKSMGLSMGQFRDLIKDELLVQKLSTKLQEEVKLTPDDLKEVKASHILVSNEAEAKDLLSRVKKGEDFAALAKKYSKDPGSAPKGGDLGYFTSGVMVVPFEQAAFSLKPGEVSEIIKTPFGCHIIKVVDARMRKIPGDPKNVDAAALREKQQKNFQRWYSEVRGKAKIEIVSPMFKGNDLRMRGQVKEAIEQYKKAAAQYPANPLVHVYLGDCYIVLGQKELAISEYENAVKLSGGNPDLYITLGKAYENAGRKDLASAQFKSASMVAGDNKATHEKLLKTFEQLKLGKEAAFERSEIKRIEKKEKFEKELTGGKKTP